MTNRGLQQRLARRAQQKRDRVARKRRSIAKSLLASERFPSIQSSEDYLAQKSIVDAIVQGARDVYGQEEATALSRPALNALEARREAGGVELPKETP